MAERVSSEFISLCQAQLRSLTTQLAAASAAIYMADVVEKVSDVSAAGGHREEPNFVPVVSWPGSVETWLENLAQSDRSAHRVGPLALPASQLASSTVSEGAAATGVSTTGVSTTGVSATDEFTTDEFVEPEHPDTRQYAAQLQPEQQLVVPLVYADVVVGLLVAIRCDRPWQHDEQDYMEDVACSLAAGCVLERRNQWLQGQNTHKRDLQSRQSEIFHNLLHQFRNPLTAVSTFGQLLVKRLEPEDPNQRIATGIVRESKRLREMVTHFDETVAVGDAELAADVSSAPLLPATPLRLPDRVPTENDGIDSDDTAALTTGLGHALTLSAQYLPDIVEPILAVSRIVAQEKGVELHAQVASDTPSVWGEEEALGEVVSNLVDNAVKYSPVGAQVWVQTGVSRLNYQGIVVGDTGPGIPQLDQSRLFERNYRGVQAESDIPGTGLGLAIAKTLITQMQGFIEVISPAVNTPWMPASAFQDADFAGPGTVFVVWLLEVERPNVAIEPVSGT